MAIVQDHFFIGEREFIRTHSDAGFKVHGGSPEADYDVAEDPAEFNRQYTETDIPVNPEDAEDILNILMGVEE